MRGDSIESILMNYNSLNVVWEESLETNLQPDIKGRVIGEQAQMQQFSLLFGLKLCERILKVTDNLSKTLQNKSLSAAEVQHVTELTVTTLKNVRTENNFLISNNHTRKYSYKCSNFRQLCFPHIHIFVEDLA